METPPPARQHAGLRVCWGRARPRDREPLGSLLRLRGDITDVLSCPWHIVIQVEQEARQVVSPGVGKRNMLVAFQSESPTHELWKFLSR